jgi:predicted negative regulator of RcsB-dependent stress response
MARELFLNEATGESMTGVEYHRALKLQEREVFRFDRAVDHLQSSLKAAKEDRLKAIAVLRSLARDFRAQVDRPKVVKIKNRETRDGARGPQGSKS